MLGFLLHLKERFCCSGRRNVRVKVLVLCLTIFLILVLLIFDIYLYFSSHSQSPFEANYHKNLENSSSYVPASDCLKDLLSDTTDHGMHTKMDGIKESLKTDLPKDSNNDYSKMYPDFYTKRPEEQVVLNKTVFLTFDDGPSERTPEILDILKNNGIKATFFVVGKTDIKSKEYMKRIVDEGHTIAMHSYTHDFRKIYASVEAYLEDIYKLYNLIYEVTGVKPSIFRFAGGSKNSFNKNNYREIISEMVRRGFDYFDWNLCNNDAVSRSLTPVNKCVDNVLKNSKNCDTGVVLMHDAKPKTTTVASLQQIIDGLKEQGFSFERLTNEISPKIFSLTKPYL